MPAGLGEAGQVWIHFDAGPPELIWQNPADFNSAGVEINQTFTAPAGATEMGFSYMVAMDSGWLAYAEPELQWLRPEYTITRKTYSLGGQTIAARISGDPVSGNNGLFYIHTDHLGSTSVMSDENGQKVPGSAAHYLPFGGWRVEPSHDLTDQAFTGQKHNMDIGLYYYNARYYLPGAGRFLSADPIVPDPANPQQYNRYAYTLNNPIRYTDPTGHCAAPFDGASREDNLQSEDSACWTIYYNWLDKGYTGLDPDWDYVRADIWLIEELYLQHGVQFASIWHNVWSIDEAVSDGQFGQRCYGSDCSVSYQRLLISSGNAYLTLNMDGAAAWLFQSFYKAINPIGQSIRVPIRGIGTDPNTYLREAMQNYGTAYTDYWNEVGNTMISGTGFVLSVASTPITNYVGVGAAIVSGYGFYKSIGAANDASARQAAYLTEINQYIYALQVRIYD